MSDAVLSAVRRSDEAWCGELAAPETLGFGVAFVATQHRDVPEATQLRNVWLADGQPEQIYTDADAHFDSHGVRCRRWVPASGQSAEGVHALLVERGWRRIERRTFVLPPGAGPTDSTKDIRILPARAMRKAYLQTIDRGESVRAAATDRLNDSNLDAYVAMLGQESAGRAAFLEVGDIARLIDVWVRPEFRRRGVGRALVAHFVQLCRRLLPREAVTACDAGDAAASAFLERMGFLPDGVLVEFHRD